MGVEFEVKIGSYILILHCDEEYVRSLLILYIYLMGLPAC